MISVGIEPTTFCLIGGYSNHLSYEVTLSTLPIFLRGWRESNPHLKINSLLLDLRATSPNNIFFFSSYRNQLRNSVKDKLVLIYLLN